MVEPQESTGASDGKPEGASSVQVAVLGPMRGLAALSVCLFHFTNGVPDFLPDGDIVKQLGSFGFLGVQVFFVISGFVIPLSMRARGYQLGDVFTFMVRRLKRLEPPYFASILLVIALHLISSSVPGFKGEAFTLTWQQALARIAYLNAVLDLGWLSPVFWALAIEFQFYLFIALLFPLLNHERFWLCLLYTSPSPRDS